MSYKEEKHLENQIRTFEDILLRSKNVYEIEQVRGELLKMRIRLQKHEIPSIYGEVLTGLLFYFSRLRIED